MSIRFHCPHCGKCLNAPPEAAGKKTKCTGCGQRLVIPAEPSLPAVVPTAAPVPVHAVATLPVCVPCPHCSGQVGYVASLAGQPVNCPLCGQPFVMSGGNLPAWMATVPQPQADPFPMEGRPEPPESAPDDRRRRSQEPFPWMKAVGIACLFVGALVLFVISRMLDGGGVRSSRLSVSDFKSAVGRLDKNRSVLARDEHDDILYKVNRDAFLAAVGKPSSKVEVGDHESWFWDCRNGQVQIMIDFTSDNTDLVFKFGSVVER